MTIPKIQSTRSVEEQDLCKRISDRPLIFPSDIKPSDSRLEVFGVLNPTFIEIGGVRRLIVRVDERPVRLWKNGIAEFGDTRTLSIARIRVDNACKIEIVERKVSSSFDPDKEPFLPETIRIAGGKTEQSQLLLSYISHLRFAEFHSEGIVVREQPIIFPDSEFSEFGCEDPRSTILEGRPIVTYSAQSKFGSTSWIAEFSSNGDLKMKRLLLGPDHKHSALFPQRIGYYYYMLIRPLTRLHIRANGLWIVRSPDLVHWGEPFPLLFPRSHMWDSNRVGPSTTPVLTANGWLFFYYGVDSDLSYQVGAVLLDSENPTRIIGRTSRPVLSPILDWERNGRRADTVFPCGLEIHDNMKSVRLYYGAADTYIGAADISVPKLMRIFSATKNCLVSNNNVNGLQFN